MKRILPPLALLCGALLTGHPGHAQPAAPAALEPSSSPLTPGSPDVMATAVGTRIPAAAVRLTEARQGGNPLGAGELKALAETLLRDGAEPLGCELPAGVTTLVLQLDRARPLRRCELINLSVRAGGRVALATSSVQLPAESARWRVAPGALSSFSGELGDAQAESATVRELDLTAEARYVRVELTLPSPGRVAALGLFERAAEPRLVAAFSIGRGSAATSSSADMGSRGVALVSAGENGRSAAAMIDGDYATGHTFRTRSSRGALVVFDLGHRAAPGRVTVSYRAGAAGRVDAYLLDELSAARSGGTPPEPTVRQLLASRTPDATAPLSAGAGNNNLQRAGLPLGAAQGRYLALVFVGGGRGGNGGATEVDFKGRAVDGKNVVSTDGRDSTGDRTGSGRPDAPDGPDRPDGGLRVLEITASNVDRYGPLLTTSTGANTFPGGVPGAPPGISTTGFGDFFAPAGNFSSVNPGVDSAGPLLPPGFSTNDITP